MTSRYRGEFARKEKHIYAGGGVTKSCGLCLKHYQAKGGSKDIRRGWICQGCTDLRRAAVK